MQTGTENFFIRKTAIRCSNTLNAEIIEKTIVMETVKVHMYMP